MYKNIVVGLNNKIAKNVFFGSNIKIGNNNIIYPGTKIYKNTIIGDNNVILSGNILGEYPVHASCEYKNLKKKGLIIGNNNFLHINNIIFSGHDNKTIIGNHNKLLAENHIGHDAKIYNNVVLYPRTIIGGFSQLMDYSGIGMSAIIHQNLVIGPYSFIGMNNTITKNSFPFFINIENNMHKLNKKKIESILDYNYLIYKENELKEISKINDFKQIKNFIEEKFNDNNDIKKILNNYYNNIFGINSM